MKLSDWGRKEVARFEKKTPKLGWTGGPESFSKEVKVVMSDGTVMDKTVDRGLNWSEPGKPLSYSSTDWFWSEELAHDEDRESPGRRGYKVRPAALEEFAKRHIARGYTMIRGVLPARPAEAAVPQEGTMDLSTFEVLSQFETEKESPTEGEL